MTLKLKTPPMPDVVNAWTIQTTGDLLEALLQDRDAQWLALVGPVVEALRWYIETDEVSEIDENEFWLRGKERGEAALRAITEEQE